MYPTDIVHLEAYVKQKQKVQNFGSQKEDPRKPLWLSRLLCTNKTLCSILDAIRHRMIIEESFTAVRLESPVRYHTNYVKTYEGSDSYSVCVKSLSNRVGGF